ncbi:predicted protein [Postia placenta Mad-698-R]|nr:predicted protein [Postia placenta Mad-698-R]
MAASIESISEKVVEDRPVSLSKHGDISRPQSTVMSDHPAQEKSVDVAAPLPDNKQSDEPTTQVTKPVSFLSLFRYSTTSEKTIDCLGLVAAAAAGAAQDLSITFPAGKTTALVGASGSGKSTVISLTERFYDPLEGVVRLDGNDLKTLNLKWLRCQIGLVSQEPTLFATTIMGNVAHGLIGTKWEHAPDDERMALIKEACVKANADGFITKLPLGYETMVGERGFLLSGGQKQRIAIARAIVSDPKILLLDEATSALDTQSEGIVQNALDKAAHGRTTITIAHRLSTIKDADRIYVMGDGLVLEAGTHNELLRDENGAYSRLVAAQKLRDSREKHATEESDSATVASDEDEDYDKVAQAEVPLQRQKSGRSLASEILEQRQQGGVEQQYGMIYLLRRFFAINKENWRMYLFGSIASICNGATYPSFGIVFAKGINGFSDATSGERRHSGDRVALWFFIIAILSAIAIGFQNYFFASTAAQLTNKIRSLSFRAIVRQDIEYFDKDENNNIYGTVRQHPSGNGYAHQARQPSGDSGVPHQEEDTHHDAPSTPPPTRYTTYEPPPQQDPEEDVGIVNVNVHPPQPAPQISSASAPEPNTELMEKLEEAQAEIERLRHLISSMPEPSTAPTAITSTTADLRRRRPTSPSDDTSTTWDGETEVGTYVEDPIAPEGVPLQVVIIIALGVFVTTYLFF